MADMSIPLKYHGLLLNDFDDHSIGDCPFCDANGHFYVNRRNGLWDCKVCGESGNLYTFLNRIHEIAVAQTKRTDYAALYRAKGIPQATLRKHGLCVSPFNPDLWLLPAYSTKATVVNLYTWRIGDVDDSNEIHSTKGLGHSLLNLHRHGQNPEATIYVTEGHWDTYVVQEMIDTLKLPDYCLGTPGAHVFDPSWTKFFARRRVYILGDNDEPGRKGVDRKIKILREAPIQPLSISVLRWPPEVGKDVRDVFLSPEKLMA